jgi:hypothetical protein
VAHAVHIPPPPPGDSLTDLTDDQLWNFQILADLACTRSKSSITRQREKFFCFTGRVLKVEADQRSLPSPPAHSGIHDLRQ